MRKRSSFESVSFAELMARGLVADIEGSLAIGVPSGEVMLSAAPQPTALVVDDEAAIADTLAAILSLNGFSAKSAYNAEAALKMSLARPPDVLITDVVMPGMNGVELATAVQERWPNCRILLISGNAAYGDLLPADRNSLDFAFLAKPLHPEDLLKKLAEWGFSRLITTP